MGIYQPTDAERAQVADQCCLLQQAFKRGDLDPSRVVTVLHGLISGLDLAQLEAARGCNEQPSKHDLAQKACDEMKRFYGNLGFAVEVPVPTVGGRRLSNNEIKRQQAFHRWLFYRPSHECVPFEGLMKALGVSLHNLLRVEHQTDRQRCVLHREDLGWEGANAGYWFWIDVPKFGEKFAHSFEERFHGLNAPSLEEYLIASSALVDLFDQLVDQSTFTLLRTSCTRDDAQHFLFAGMPRRELTLAIDQNIRDDELNRLRVLRNVTILSNETRST